MPLILSSSGNPPTYPENGTYADLLCWHLYVWRTRPGGSRSERGKDPWGIPEFKKKVFAPGGSTDAEGKNYRNWTGKNKKCPPDDLYHEAIVKALFDNEPQFETWIKDLDFSRGISSPKGKNILNIIIKDEIDELLKAIKNSELSSASNNNYLSDALSVRPALSNIPILTSISRIG